VAGAALGGVPPATDEKAVEEPVKATRERRTSLKAGDTRDYRVLGGFYLLADAGGIYALTAICTHRGCMVSAEGAEGFGCPCHDSEYDRNGAVTQGPAPLPLKHYLVREAEPGGLLVVDLSKTVDPGARL
jgi:Rieske Fe-S protein